jgi:aldehyde dehydrogenase (NAD+)
MGPVLVVQRAKTFEEALGLCNGVRQGLIAALFTNSPLLQTEFLKTARAGILKLNSSTAGVDVTLPFDRLVEHCLASQCRRRLREWG